MATLFCDGGHAVFGMAIKQIAPEPVLPFATQRKFAAWLAKHHASSSGVWIKIAKAASGIPSIKYAEAVETALCWGWIDSQTKGIDENWYVQRFTPRGKRSPWSKINCAKAECADRRRQDECPPAWQKSSAPREMGAGLARTTRPPARPFPTISRPRSPRNRGRQTSSITWMRRTGMRFSTGYKQQRRPKPAQDASRTSSGCWREKRSCIPRARSGSPVLPRNGCARGHPLVG